jgi:hypothetical protein
VFVVKRGVFLGLLLVWCAYADRSALAQPRASADVVVVVDTSTSMKQPGMDPARTSLLVSKLLADVVPGDLAVVRLLDISRDSALIPSRGTGQFMPCSEDASRRCERVEQATDWLRSAREQGLGVLVRPQRGDARYKVQLEAHLEQHINNSMFALAFGAAQGVFEGHRPQERKRTLVWLSDGRSDGEPEVKRLIGELKQAGVNVEAVVFGRGDLRLPTEAALSPIRVTTPGELMQAFAGAFRRMVQAPYELDNTVEARPTFQIRPQIDEAWVVVYGDTSLSSAWLEGPAGRIEADFAQDRHEPAGAYRVAYLVRPPAGQWTVHVNGGGSGVAYAVVQRSGIAPAFLGPSTATIGSDATVVAELRGSDGGPLRGPDIPPDMRLTASQGANTIPLFDDGTHGDATGGDGRFSGVMTFGAPGDVRVNIHARSDVTARSVEGIVKVSGSFDYLGGPISVDLETLAHHSEACRPLPIDARQQGTLPFTVRGLQAIPSAHRLEIRGPAGVGVANGAAIRVSPGDRLKVCLVTEDASSSEAAGDPWIELSTPGGRPSPIVVKLRWRVNGMTFWERWGWLILLILTLSIIAFVIYGFVKPWRFARTLALVFVPDQSDLVEQTPQPIRQWQGVGIRWYRDARAYLHPNFRVTRKASGAVASLRAAPAGTTLVHPENGHALFRENASGEWEAIPADGRSIRPGEAHRVGEYGPFFVTSVRRS